MNESTAHAPRTYLRRRGRLTRGQARALAELSARYRLAAAGAPIDTASEFGRAAPLGLEIGFGMGQALIDWARRCPDWNLLGVEVYQPGVGSAMLGFEREHIGNVRVIEGMAEPVLADRLAPASLDEVRIFFPDPWPKKRHHKRRLIQPELAALLASRLRPDALLWVATDWAEYAAWIADVLDAEPALRPAGPPDGAAHDRPLTRFESRGRRLGHAVRELRYARKR